MGGCLVALPADQRSEAVEAIELQLRSGSIAIPVEQIGVNEKGYRLKFSEVSLNHRRELVRIVLARSDAWVRAPRKQDRPLRSLVTIASCIWDVACDALKVYRMSRKRNAVPYKSLSGEQA
jgi:cellulose synthase (UDP-forming)